MTLSKQSGFTLIELLVVIAIIGILSAVVLGSLNDARQSAKESTVAQEMNSLQNLMALNALEIGHPRNYTNDNINGVWIQTEGSANLCSNVALRGLTPSKQTQFRQLCESITDVTGNSNFFMRWHTGNSTYQNHYTFMARVQGNAKVICVGSGGKSIGTYNPGGVNWSGEGCANDPDNRI